MGRRIFVGNLSFDTSSEGLRGVFEEKGWSVTDIHVVTDRETGRSRGFAFVELGSDDQAQAAITALDGADLGGRRLKVNEARERERRPAGGGGYGGGGHSGGARGGGGYAGGGRPGGGYGGGGYGGGGRSSDGGPGDRPPVDRRGPPADRGGWGGGRGFEAPALPDETRTTWDNNKKHDRVKGKKQKPKSAARTFDDDAYEDESVDDGDDDMD